MPGYWEIYAEAKKRKGKSGSEGLLWKDAVSVVQIAYYEGIMNQCEFYKNWSLMHHYACRIQDYFESAGIKHEVIEVGNPAKEPIPPGKKLEAERMRQLFGEGYALPEGKSQTTAISLPPPKELTASDLVECYGCGWYGRVSECLTLKSGATPVYRLS